MFCSLFPILLGLYSYLFSFLSSYSRRSPVHLLREVMRLESERARLAWTHSVTSKREYAVNPLQLTFIAVTEFHLVLRATF
jgi:hypothetical protein